MAKLILFDNLDKIILTESNELLDKKLIEFLDIEPVRFNIHSQKNVINICSDSQNSLEYYTGILPTEFLNSDNSFTKNVLPNSKLHSFKSYLLNSSMDMVALMTKARQLAFWDFNHRFCGRCASKTKTMDNENAKVCLTCGYINYPRLTPCILAAVIKQDKVLLGRAPHFPAGVYSLLAGFVEVGENCEQTVAREVFEESGISIENIRYFGSQSWPFPHSMMMAYLADYKAGDIVVDKNELEDVRWFSFEGLRTCPDLLPAKGSLSRALIDKLINDFVTS